MTPAAGIEALKMAAGLAMTLFKMVQEERARLPNGPDRERVEAAMAEAMEMLADVWMYEPKNPRATATRSTSTKYVCHICERESLNSVQCVHCGSQLIDVISP